MECPKCKYEQADGKICPSCGIVFEKYYMQKNKLPETTLSETTLPDENMSNSNDIVTIGSLLFNVEQSINPIFFIGRLSVYILILIWGWLFLTSSIESNYVGESFMHMVNLPFHEAGHIIFKPFGVFITSLGGTLGQLLMPLVCMCVLLIRTRDPFGASVSFWWFGQNFLDIAPYINDARAGQLLLIGGNFGHSSPYGFHDWEFILTESGFLQYDHLLAKTSFIIGALIILLSLIWSGFLMFKQYTQIKIEV